MEITEHYNGTVKLQFDPEKHHYTVGNKTVDGVTSVLDVIAKPALIAWAANKTAEYVEQNLPVNTAIDEITKMKLIKECKGAYRKKAQDAADIGTLFHSWVEDYINDKNPEIPTNPMFKKAVEQFLKWVNDKEVKFEASERKILSLRHGYCGTCDFVAKIGGKTVLGDIKTSTGIWNEYWLQTAAYKHAYQEEFPKVKIDHCVIVRCAKNGDFEVKELNDFDKNFSAFLGALTLHRRLKEMKFLDYINS